MKRPVFLFLAGLLLLAGSFGSAATTLAAGKMSLSLAGGYTDPDGSLSGRGFTSVSVVTINFGFNGEPASSRLLAQDVSVSHGKFTVVPSPSQTWCNVNSLAFEVLNQADYSVVYTQTFDQATMTKYCAHPRK